MKDKCGGSERRCRRRRRRPVRPVVAASGLSPSLKREGSASEM